MQEPREAAEVQTATEGNRLLPRHEKQHSGNLLDIIESSSEAVLCLFCRHTCAWPDVAHKARLTLSSRANLSATCRPRSRRWKAQVVKLTAQTRTLTAEKEDLGGRAAKLGDLLQSRDRALVGMTSQLGQLRTGGAAQGLPPDTPQLTLTYCNPPPGPHQQPGQHRRLWMLPSGLSTLQCNAAALHTWAWTRLFYIKQQIGLHPAPQISLSNKGLQLCSSLPSQS